MKETIGVIGGGISGLTFSHYCTKNNHRVKLFDDQRYEACINTYHSGQEQNIETGAHTLYNSYKHIIELIRDYQLESSIVPKEKLRFVKYDRGLRRLSQGLHWLELLTHLPGLLIRKKNGNTVREYYSSILGRKNYDELFSAAFQAVLCQQADDYPAELLFRKRQQNKSFPRSFTLKAGIEGLLNAISGNPLINLNPDMRVNMIQREGSQFNVQNEHSITTVPYICLACPPDSASQLAGGFDPELASMLSAIQTICVESVLIRTSKQAATKKNIIGINQPFFSALYTQNKDENYWLFHFEGLKYSNEEKLLIISKTIGIPGSDLTPVIQRSAKMPSVKAGQLQLLTEIDRYIRDKPVFISSNYMQGLALEDCCERAKKESQRFFEMTGRLR